MTAPTQDMLTPEMRTKHVHTWCPFCYLGWPRYLPGQCVIPLPTGRVMAHVPAITFDRENVGSMIMNMLGPRPWEISQLVRARIDPRTVRRTVKGLAEALERDAEIRGIMRNAGPKMSREPAEIVWLARRDAIAAQQQLNDRRNAEPGEVGSDA